MDCASASGPANSACVSHVKPATLSALLLLLLFLLLFLLLLRARACVRVRACVIVSE
jgi:hypothetical protein